MHLTNYAINKNSNKFIFNESETEMSQGHKRSLTSVLLQLKELGLDTTKIWSDICDCVVKTLISVQPILGHTYRSCQPRNISNDMCF